MDVPTGALDITLYRDDLMRHAVGPQPVVRRTEIPFSIDGRDILLDDDVRNTGRTIRAALDVLIDFGRPSAIELVALVDLGHRELPIRCGLRRPGTSRRRASRERAGPAGRDRRPRRSGGGRMSTTTALRSRHLLGITDLEAGEIELILETALAMKEVGTRPIKKVPTMRGRTVDQPVPRAEHPHPHVLRDGGQAPQRRRSASPPPRPAAKGETLADTARTSKRWRRHDRPASSGQRLAPLPRRIGVEHHQRRRRHARAPDAGPARRVHHASEQHKRRLQGLRVAIVGYFVHSRVLRSNALLLVKMGAEVRACGPATLVPLGLSASASKVTRRWMRRSRAPTS